MKINNLSNKKRFSLVAAILVAVSAGLAIAVATYDQTSVNKLSDTSKDGVADDKKIQASLDDEKQISPKPNNINELTNTDQPLPPTSSSETGRLTVSMSTSSTIADGIVYIRGGIDNSVVFNGNCYALLIGPNGQLIRKDTELLQNASTTDCKTIQINISELSKGSWKYSLNYSSENEEGSSGESSFDIN